MQFFFGGLLCLPLSRKVYGLSYLPLLLQHFHGLMILELSQVDVSGSVLIKNVEPSSRKISFEAVHWFIIQPLVRRFLERQEFVKRNMSV